jgi:hypothetical protein
MMKAIWKYAINPKTAVAIPEGARLLSVQTQDNQPQLWTLVDPERPMVKRNFVSMATGEPFDDEGLVYVGTFQINSGGLVFHVFEVTA